jgi:ATP-dependent helicase/DNAse subunit B
MPLTLITGPANAAKAGAVLDRLRAALPRDPLLVVPTAADVEHYQRELAGSGIVFGAEVLTFARLVREIATRTGLDARPLGRVARDRVVRAAIAGVPLRILARSAATPGFADAAAALFAELQRSLVPPARFTSALRSWAAAAPEGGASAAETGPSGARAAYADELAALYSAYRRRLERLGRPDREGYAWAALDALRADPAAWGRRPVFLYGFDDLTPTERDAVETLSGHAGADVCVALPYEPGRVAFAGRAATVEELRPLAADVVHLPERSEHYAPAARPALHHLERELFEPAPDRRPPNGAVRLLEAGGERAEAELVGAAVLELMRQGIEAPDIAVLLRGDAATTALFAQVLAGYGIPVSHDRRVPLGRTRLGAGVLAGARAALAGGTAADLLTWLRTPGRLADPAPADALDVRVRRGGVRTARAARTMWETRLGGPPLTGLDTLATAAAEGPEALLAALVAEAEEIWTAPHHRRAEVLAAEDLADARVAADLRAASG